MQGPFWVWSQPMRDDVSMWHHLSLAEPLHRIIPGMCAWNVGLIYINMWPLSFVGVLWVSRYLMLQVASTVPSAINTLAQANIIIILNMLISKVFLGNVHDLTHLPPMPHICVSELGHHWFRWWLVACSALSHYLNQCWFTANWTLENKFQWNLNHFHTRKCIWKWRLPKWRPFCPRGDQLTENDASAD